MVSECKICGARTAGHRQYCPDCRRNHKGRGHRKLTKFEGGLLLTGMGILLLFLINYSIKKHESFLYIFPLVLLDLCFFSLGIKFIRLSSGYDNKDKTSTILSIIFSSSIVILFLLLLILPLFSNMSKEIIDYGKNNPLVALITIIVVFIVFYMNVKLFKKLINRLRGREEV